MVESYDSAIDKSYETLFADIENLYKGADREDNKLFDIISEFACVHDDIYFEAEMLVGFQLYFNSRNDRSIPHLAPYSFLISSGGNSVSGRFVMIHS